MKKAGLAVLILIVVLIAALVLFVQEQQEAQTIGVVTYVDHAVLNKIEAAFKNQLQELRGESGELLFLRGNAQGKKGALPETVQSVLAGDPEVLVTISTPVSQAALRAVDSECPVVFTFVTNPSDLGDELTRANCTGLSDAVNYSENLRLIRRILPNAKRLGYVYNPNEANSVYGIKQVRQLAPSLDFVVVEGTVTNESEVPSVARQIANSADVLYVGGDNTVVGAIAAVVTVGNEIGVPVFASDIGSIELGAIAGVSVDYEQLGKETAQVVYEVLQGKAPRDIPRRVVLGDQIVINRSASDVFRITIPKDVLEEAHIKLD